MEGVSCSDTMKEGQDSLCMVIFGGSASFSWLRDK